MTMCLLAFGGLLRAQNVLPFEGNNTLQTNDLGTRDSLVLLTDGFEVGDGTDVWTLIDADGDTDTWRVIGCPFGPAHGGEKVITSWSWNGISYDPDNYMISPLVEGATNVHYFVSTNEVFPDHYGIMVSTTGTELEDFFLVFEEDAYVPRAMSEWAERNIELPEGTRYVAFRHFNSYGMNYLLLDDVTIYAAEPSTALPNHDENAFEVSVYPNPTNGLVKITAKGVSRVTVMNTIGQVVYDAAVNADECELNMTRYNAGVYVVRIATENGVSTQRVTVE